MDSAPSKTDDCTVIIHYSYEKSIQVPYQYSLTEARQAVADSFMQDSSSSHDLSTIKFATSACGFRSYESTSDTETSDVDTSDVGTSDVGTSDVDTSDVDTSDVDTSATEAFDTDSDVSDSDVEIGSIDKGAIIHAIFPCNTLTEEAGSQTPRHRQAPEAWQLASWQARLEAVEKNAQRVHGELQQQLSQSDARIQLLEDAFRKAVSLPIVPK
jgi:hypothetical protein